MARLDGQRVAGGAVATIRTAPCGGSGSASFSCTTAAIQLLSAMKRIKAVALKPRSGGDFDHFRQSTAGSAELLRSL